MQNNLFTLIPAEVHVKECVDIYLADIKRRIEKLQACQDELDRRTSTGKTADLKTEIIESNNIKILITKFEDFSKAQLITSISNMSLEFKERVDVLKLLQSFEQLSKNEMLHESIAYIKQVRDPIEPMKQCDSEEQQVMYDPRLALPSTSQRLVKKNSLWEKIFQFEHKTRNISIEVDKIPASNDDEQC